MKVPLSAKMAMGMYTHMAPVRPKHFFMLSIESKSGDVKIVRYVRSWPWLLRFRLFAAKQKLIVAYKKAMIFKDNQGL